jgi:glycosyltransferase involved in cell wall biosynthesis
MRILVYPHDLNMGGSQLNAIEIAAALKRRGHEVIIFGHPGSLNDRLSEIGLEFIAAPQHHHQPSPSNVKVLAGIAKDRGIDVVHGYEWPPALESRLAADRTPGTVSVATVMSMAVAPFIPRSMPLIVGTREILEAERAFGRSRAELLEPPVDVEFNSPDVELPLAEFRRNWGLDPEALTVVLVSRLAPQLKLEGILAAMEAVAALSADFKLQLLVAGDGPAADQVQSYACHINRASGRTLIILTGELKDPRPAYAVADITLGMGGSALRALAFAKPLVVQGEVGFWELLSPETLHRFSRQGWYGIGEGSSTGQKRLERILRDLLEDRVRRSSLGKFGLNTVRERFSLERAARVQEDFYRRAIALPPARSARHDAFALLKFAEYKVASRARSLLAKSPAEDFNARPVSGSSTLKDESPDTVAGVDR